MQSEAGTVEEYLDEAPSERRPRLREIRELCREVLGAHDERMLYGMPAYVRDDAAGFAFASQRNYISLYVERGVVVAHEDQLAGMDVGKGCIRFKSPEQIDMRLVRSLLEGTRDSAEAPC